MLSAARQPTTRDGPRDCFLGVERSALGRRWVSRVGDDGLALARAYVRMTRLDDAADRLGQVARSAPDEPRVHYDLARVRLALGDRAGAVTALRRTLELAPDHAGAASALSKLDTAP